MAWPNGVGISQ